MGGPRAGQGAGELASGPDVQQHPAWVKASARRLALAALPSLSGVVEARKLGPHPSLAPCARAWLQGPAAGSPEPAQLPLPCAGGARLSGPPRRRASAVCPLLCTSEIARSHVGSPPHAGLVSLTGACASVAVSVSPVSLSTLALAFSLSAPWGPSWSSGAPWRPSLQYPAVSASWLRL